MPSDGGPKQKRVTTAVLSSQLQEVMNVLPQLTQHVKTLADRQSVFEQQMPTLGKSTAVAVAQPLGAALDLPRGALSSAAKAIPPPPRTMTRPSLGLLASPSNQKPMELQAMELEKEALAQSSGQISGDALAQAVLMQSQALTNLVSQIAQSQGDPMAELTATSSAGARGATGRAKLQAELAMHKGLFFRAVTQSMARRMSPTTPSDIPPAEMLERGISGVKYLERFGGYGKHRELGQLMFQVMTAFDYMMAGQMEAAMDTAALLAVSIEQANLDGGRMDLANLLCLQEDAPASIFMYRQTTIASKTKAFAPLADQRWVTCALAFLKEMEVIAAKRQELVSQSKPSEPLSEGTTPKPKPKGKPGPKRKGGGKGQTHQSEETEA